MVPLALNRSRKGLDAAPRGGGGCVREVLTQPSRNRALLWSSPPMALNADVSRFLLWLGRCFISDKGLRIRHGGHKADFPVCQPSPPAVLLPLLLPTCLGSAAQLRAGLQLRKCGEQQRIVKPFSLLSSSVQRRFLGKPAQLWCSGPLLREQFPSVKALSHGFLPKTTWLALPSSAFATQVSSCGLPATPCPHLGTWHHPSTDLGKGT